MLLKHLLPCMAWVVILTGCAGTQEQAKPPASIAWSMTEAEAALKAGQGDQAAAILVSAAKAFPAEKAPRLRLAQLRFDSNNYGEAIVYAHEVLERDADDLLAHSIAAVSGLRVASKALADLTQKNDLTGSIRAEAADLAKLLRTSIGTDVLVPGTKPRPPKLSAPKPPSTPALLKNKGTNPFDSLD